MACCFKACNTPNEDTWIQMEIFATEEGSGILQLHEPCFEARCSPAITYDDPREHGHIPKNAKCVLCGDPLPTFGRHPYCFEIGDYSPPHRYWAHNQCMKAILTAEAREKLPF